MGVITITVQNLPGADIRTAVSYVAKVRADVARRAARMRVCTRFAGPEQALELCDMMVRHGWDDTAVRGVLGENFLRAAGESWGG